MPNTMRKGEPTKVEDHPTEDMFGDEIQKDDYYYKFGEDIVASHNLHDYLTEYLHVQVFKAE